MSTVTHTIFNSINVSRYYKTVIKVKQQATCTCNTTYHYLNTCAPNTEGLHAYNINSTVYMYSTINVSRYAYTSKAASYM